VFSIDSISALELFILFLLIQNSYHTYFLHIKLIIFHNLLNNLLLESEDHANLHCELERNKQQAELINSLVQLEIAFLKCRDGKAIATLNK
jgi:hypothetical protein